MDYEPEEGRRTYPASIKPKPGHPRFRDILDVATPDRSADEEGERHADEKGFGEAVIRNWVRTARWYWPDEEVSEILAREVERLRGRS